MLLYAGRRARSFTDPMTFLAYACDHQPRVVVLDIVMPGLNGLEVQRRLRRVSPSTRVVILSSRDDPVVRATAIHQGASAFFIKGVETKELLVGIESALGENNHEVDGLSADLPFVTVSSHR